MNTPRKYDISDKLWKKLEPLLPGQEGLRGGIARDNRQFVNAVFWILKTGAPWRNLPPEYGDWKNTNRRFCRWRDRGVWDMILEKLIDEPELEWMIINEDYIKDHMYAIEEKQGIGFSKRGEATRYISPWLRMICRSDLLLQTMSRMTIRKLERLLRK